MQPRLKILFKRAYDSLFRTQKPIQTTLPEVNPFIPYDQLDRINGVRGFVNDTRPERVDDSRYYNRQEPNVDRDISRLTRILKFWGVLPSDFPAFKSQNGTR